MAVTTAGSFMDSGGGGLQKERLQHEHGSVHMSKNNSYLCNYGDYKSFIKGPRPTAHITVQLFCTLSGEFDDILTYFLTAILYNLFQISSDPKVFKTF